MFYFERKSSIEPNFGRILLTNSTEFDIVSTTISLERMGIEFGWSGVERKRLFN